MNEKPRDYAGLVAVYQALVDGDEAAFLRAFDALTPEGRREFLQRERRFDEKLFGGLAVGFLVALAVICGGFGIYQAVKSEPPAAVEAVEWPEGWDLIGVQEDGALRVGCLARSPGSIAEPVIRVQCWQVDPDPRSKKRFTSVRCESPLEFPEDANPVGQGCR